MKKCQHCKLSDISGNICCKISKINATDDLLERFLSLGIVPEREVEVLRKSINGKTLQLLVGSSLVALRDTEASQIEVVI